jgi:hypothetical protein
VSSNLPAVTNLRLLHISIDFHGELDTEAIKKTFGKAIDWIYYMPNCWLVLTSSDPDRWYARLQPLLADLDTMLIYEVKPEALSGWLAGWIVEWIDKAQQRILKSKHAS